MVQIGLVDGKYFEQLNVGDQFSSQITLTETHLVLGSALFGDFNPVHVNQVFIENTRFPKRIFPGPFTLGVMASSLGNYFSGSAVANTRISSKFTNPVYPGDTLLTTWTIQEKNFKEKLNAGFVDLIGQGTNQKGEIVAEASAQVLVNSSTQHN